MNPARVTLRIARRGMAVLGIAALLVAGRKVWGSGLNLIALDMGDREPVRRWPDSSDWED